MNKQKFIELVDNPSRICAKDAGILAELARNYPYSPLVHTMLAKAHQSSPDASERLATAAIHIANRSVLKEVMEGSFREHAPTTGSLPVEESDIAKAEGQMQKEAPNAEDANTASTASYPIPEAAAPQEVVEKKNIVQELEENLRKLKEQREHFETPGPEKEETSGPNPINRLGTLPEALQDLLKNKEEKEIKDPKKIEQINLIDNFIKNSSSISRKYRTPADENSEQNDLTSGYAFTPPELATENLAQIMTRQGKIEKAIDIYEKLILKNPQKKAYFASCIEKLKTT